MRAQPRPISVVFFLHVRLAHPLPPPFPTRRSSDLDLLRGCGLIPMDRPATPQCEAPRLGDDEVDSRPAQAFRQTTSAALDRKSTRLNSSHRCISYAVFCLKKKKKYSRITSMDAYRE